MHRAGGVRVFHGPDAIVTADLVLADPIMAALVAEGFSNSVVPGVQSSYNTATERFLGFCEVRNLRPWPVRSHMMCAFLHFISTTVAVSSMGMYKAGLMYTQSLYNMPWLLDGDEHVRRTMRFLKRKFPVAEPVEKFPMSIAVQKLLLPFLEGWPDLAAMSRGDRVFAVASVIAVCGFLRGGEFLESSNSDRSILRFDAFSVGGSASALELPIDIPQPKAKFWLESQRVKCFGVMDGADDTLCPVRLWEGYVALLPFPLVSGSPAFVEMDNKALTKKFMLDMVCKLYARSGLSFVSSKGLKLKVKASSWRAGAVRSAIDANISTPVIMACGLWRSSAWIKYFVQSGGDLKKSARAMWAPQLLSVVPLSSGARVENFDPQVLSLKEDDELGNSFQKLRF